MPAACSSAPARCSSASSSAWLAASSAWSRFHRTRSADRLSESGEASLGGVEGGGALLAAAEQVFPGGWFRGKLAILYAALANVLTAFKQAAAHVLLLLLLLLGVLLLGLLRLGLHLLPWLLRLLLLPLLLLPLLGQHQALLLHVKEL